MLLYSSNINHKERERDKSNNRKKMNGVKYVISFCLLDTGTKVRTVNAKGNYYKQ